MGSKIIRNILKGASLTTALFVFEACYGPPYSDRLNDLNVRFKVLSAEDMSPLEGIAVKYKTFEDENVDWCLAGYTYQDGTAEVSIFNPGNNEPVFRFENEEGVYMVKDTVISNLDGLIEIKLQKAH